MQWGKTKQGVSFVPPGDREKTKGNELFKQNDFQAALVSYRNGLDAVQKDLSAHGIEMRLALHLNCAAALLKLERPNEAVSACTSALVIDARNAKALLRRAKAHLGIGDTAAAGVDLATAAHLLPEDDCDLTTLRSQVAEAQAISFSAGAAKLVQGESVEALPLLQAGIDAAESAGALKVAAHGYSYMGIAHQRLGNYSQAIKCHERHLHLAEGLVGTDERVRALSNLSGAHQLNGDYQQAIAYHTQQLDFVSESTPPVDVCSLYGNMSRAYLSVGQLSKALEFQERCFQIATNLDDDQMRAKALSNLGQTLSAMGREEDALIAHRKSLLLSQSDEDEVGCVRQLEAIALLEQARGQHRKAVRSFNRVLDALEKLGNAGAHVARVRCRKAVSLHALRESVQAIEMLKDCISALRGAADREEEAYAMQQLGLIYVSQGDADKAVQCHARELKLRRELSAASGYSGKAAGGPQGAAEAKAAARLDTSSRAPPMSTRPCDGKGNGRGGDSREAIAQSHAGGVRGDTAGGGRGDNAESTAEELEHDRAGRESRFSLAATQQDAAQRELEASLALGAALSLAGRHREAIFQYTSALRKAQEARDVLEQGVLMVCIGAVLLQEGNEKLAVAAFRQGLEFLEENAGDLSSPSASLDSGCAGDGGDGARLRGESACASKRNRLFCALARALRGLQMVHIQHHQSFYGPSASHSDTAPEAGSADGASDTCSTRTASSSRPSSATSIASGGAQDNPERITATAASATAAAKEALVSALQLQALEQVVALGEEAVFEWEEIEDDLDLRSLTWMDIQDVVRISGTGLVVLSLLDREGTLAGWVVPPDGGGGVQGVRMVVMEKRDALSRIADDWSEVPALLSKVNSTEVQPRTAAPASGLENEPSAGLGGREQMAEREVLRLLYDICWSDVAEHVADWQHVRIVPHGELLLLPWGALLDSNMSPLSAKHVISLEPCLKGLIFLLRNLQPQEPAADAGAGVARQRQPVPSVSVETFLSRVRPDAPPAALVVSDPYNAQHVGCSVADRARDERDRKEDEDMAETFAPLIVPSGGFDAVQDALNNPPPGGWQPRGMGGKGATAGEDCIGNLQGGERSQDTSGSGGSSGTYTGARPSRATDKESRHAGQPSGVGGVSEEARGVTRALRAIGMEVKALAQEEASPRMVLEACKEAGWIHLAVPLVGGDPHQSDWVQGRRGDKGPAAEKRGQEKDEARVPCDEMELVMADGEMVDGERDWGFVTAKRLAADWRGKFAGATVVVAGRPQGCVIADGPKSSRACTAGGGGGHGPKEEEVPDGEGGAERDAPDGARRLLKPAPKREYGRAPPGPLGPGPLTSRCVQVWLAMMLVFPLRRCQPAEVESLMLAFYNHVAAGLPVAAALARASREAQSLASHNFVCIGAMPSLARQGSPCAPPPGATVPDTASCKASTSKAAPRPQPTQAFQWGAPSGV